MTGQSPHKHRALLLCLALVALTFAAFFPVLRCGFVYYDDPAYVYGNPHLRDGLSWDAVKWSFTALHASNWHPLTWLSHALDCSLFGLNPAGHHATNLLLHTLNSLLVLAVLRKLTGAFWRSALVAALFAIHPMHVESVAWVSERKDVLSVFFGLLALLAYTKYVTGGGWHVPRNANHASRTTHPVLSSILQHPSSKWYWLTLLCFGLSLLSKPMLVTLPCLLLLLDFWPLSRISSFSFQLSAFPRSLLLEKLPFFLLILGSIPLTLMAQQAGGSVAPIGDIPLLARLANSAIAVGWYVGKLFWPVDLAVIHPLFPTRDPIHVLLGTLVVGGCSVMAVWQLRRRPWAFAGWFWFLGTLVPVIGLVQVGMQSYADRYTYFSYIGLFLVLAWGLAELAVTPRRRILVAAGVLGALAACVLQTQHQCRFWKDSETLFGRAVSVTHSNYIALNNLGFALAERKEYDRAIECYQQALAAAPRFVESLNNLGCAYLGLRKFDLAVPPFRAALDIKPDDVRSLNNLGTALHELGDFTNAMRQYQRAVEIQPSYAEAHYNLGNTLAAAGQITNALAHYQRAIELQTNYASARLNYGVELLRLGRTAEAGEQFNRALAAGTNSYNAHFWLAAIARGQGDVAGEIQHLRAFLAADPSHAKARTQLAMALAGSQQLAAAISEAREAAQRQPDYAPAHYCLGLLHEQTSQPAEAINAYEAALRLVPDYPEALNNLAWLLTTETDSRLRNGPRAVQLATRACELTRYEMPMLIGTLAAAQAEAGQFQAALASAERAAQVAGALGDTNLAARNHQAMEWYRAGKTWREGDAQR